MFLFLPEVSSGEGAEAMRDLDVRIEEALRRIKNGNGQMRIPADPTDPDLVLHDCRTRIAELEKEKAESERQLGVCKKENADAVAGIQDMLKRSHGRGIPQLLADESALQSRLAAAVALLERAFAGATDLAFRREVREFLK